MACQNVTLVTPPALVRAEASGAFAAAGAPEPPLPPQAAMPTVRAATAPVTTRWRAARLPVDPGVAWNMRSPFRPDRTVRSQVCGARSLDRARGEPTDDEALSEDDEQEGGQQGQDDPGQDH